MILVILIYENIDYTFESLQSFGNDHFHALILFYMLNRVKHYTKYLDEEIEYTKQDVI